MRTGEIIDGKYRVERILGVGGMGIVVAARHLELGTEVALKLMLAEALADAELVERFAREARAMVRLTSPHCARVFDVGRLPNGAPYMVMELLAGHDLGDLIDKKPGPLPSSGVVDVILQTCLAVAEAHALGIVHRDLKPRNIFLSRQADGTEVVKVLDFGLAKSIETVGSKERALTRTSAVMGSPTYMSPEQMRALRDVDAGTDIWSLGVCLYELLTGSLPFEASTIPELCARVLTADPVPPRELRPELPADLDRTIMRCLEKDRSRRFRDLGELALALAPHARAQSESSGRIRHLLDTPSDRILLHEPPAHLPSLGVTRTEGSFTPRSERSNGSLVLVLGSIALAVGVGIGFAFFALRPRPVAPPAVAPPPAVASAAPAPSAPSPAPLASAAPSRAAAPPPPVTARPAPKRPPPVDAGPPAPRPITTAF